ncbi:MAG: 6-bladed beta-propeller [Planctomycetota bacterium]
MGGDRLDASTSRFRPGWIAIVVLAVGLGGCGQSKGVIFEPLENPMIWPPDPEPARIRYVGGLVTSEDLKPGRSVGQGLSEAIFGRKPARSMLSPYAVCTDGSDRLFVADSNAQTVHVFDLDSRRYEQWQPDPQETSFSQPVGVAFDGSRRLLVSDAVASTIFVFASDGTYLGDFGREYLSRPCGLAVDAATGRIFVADAAAHQVLVFNPEGALVAQIGRRGTGLGEFNFPTNVALDIDGRLFVSDSLNFRVQVFDSTLEPIRQIGGHGDLPGYFSQPKGVALDSDGHLYVVDAHFEAVQVFDTEGRLLLTFGREGQASGEFWLPAGIHIDANDRIWVADTYNRRVQVFQYLTEVE